MVPNKAAPHYDKSGLLEGPSALLLGTLADSHNADGLYLANGGSGG